jgi:predicted transport protein
VEFQIDSKPKKLGFSKQTKSETLNPKNLDQATQTMIDNLLKNTGKSLEDWIGIVREQKLQKHGDILKFLKETHGFSHGFANLVAHKALKTDAGSAENQDELVKKQYVGKEAFLPIFERLCKEIEALGDDVELIPKNAYVSVKRKKQFAMLVPATKTRFEIGINLKGASAAGVLELESKANAMCSHKIVVNQEEQITPEVISWLRKAYEAAG